MSKERKREEEMARRGEESSETPTEERAEHARQGQQGGREYRIEGEAQLQQKEQLQGEIKMHAYAFDRFGNPLGDAEVGSNGRFNLPIRMAQPGDVEVVIGPEDDPKTVRQGRIYTHQVTAAQWERGQVIRLSPFIIPIDFWWWWWWRWVCVNGHVYKVDDHGNICPVPYVKVEVYDVDRESCWWWWILNWWPYLIDRKVANAADLLRERPPALRRPFTPPGPGPVERLQQTVRLQNPGDLVSFNPQPDPPAIRLAQAMEASFGDMVSLNPQPLPPKGQRFSNPGDMVSLNPQPEPPGSNPFRNSGSMASLSPQPLPGRSEMMKMTALSARGLVGEVSTINSNLAARLSDLTIISTRPPWYYFPWCFYSKQLVCTTYTDCSGAFNCCFPWSFFHFRNGRLRFDWLPDIIIKVTQTINGVDRVIYMDPYTSARWNVSTATIDLYLDDPQIVCGLCNPPRPPGTQTFFTLVGLDEVDEIDQATGTYSTDDGSLSNVAYGGGLNIFANFGQNLSDGTHYYRISISSDGTNFTAAPTPALSDTRVNKITNLSEDHTLGPYPVGAQTGLYEVRNFNDYAWYNPDLIYQWDTTVLTSNVKYTLRLEVFDNGGNKLTSASVDFLDGTYVLPGDPQPELPVVLPASGGDYCDLALLIDNDPPYVDMEVPAAINECGVVPCGATPDIIVTATQPHNRLYSWSLGCEKGLTGTDITGFPVGGSAPGGIPNVVNHTVSGTPVLNSFDCVSDGKENKCPTICVCAFGLDLGAWPLVRNGYGFINYRHQIKSIAVEKCV